MTLCTHHPTFWPRRRAGLAALALLTGCAMTPPAAVVYDFGPGTMPLPAAPGTAHAAIAIGPIQAPAALSGTSVLYRLGYADAQQLQPYAQARWSMPPAQLIGQRLHAHLGQRHILLAPNEHLPAGAADAVLPTLSLRLELEEFSQLFDAPGHSSGLLRLRASLSRRNSACDTLLGQRSFVLQQPAPSPDARGGVHALAAASDQAIDQIETWLDQLTDTTPNRLR